MISVFILFPTLLALVFFIYFLWKSKGTQKHFIFLSLYNFLFLIILLSTLFIANSNELEDTSETINFFSLLFFVAILAIPPTFYFYTISLTDVGSDSIKEKLTNKHYYLPIILLVINIFSFIFFSTTQDDSSFVYKVIEDVMNYSNFVAILFIFPILSVFYIYLTIKKYKYHRLAIAEIFSYKKGINLKWMFYYILGYCIFFLSVYIIQGYDYTLIIIPTTLFLFCYLLFVNVIGIKQKQVKIKTDLHILNKSNETLLILDNDKKKELKKKILLTMNDEPYLNKSLTLQDFTKLIGSNSKYTSYVLNTEFKQNFSSFINSYRIEKAKKILVAEDYKKYTIESISELVGFQSKSAFNKAFKRYEGQTPSAYKKKYTSSN